MQPQQPQYPPPFPPQGGQWQQAPTMPVGAPPQQPAHFQQKQLPPWAQPPKPPKKHSVWLRVIGAAIAGLAAFMVVGGMLNSGEAPAPVSDTPVVEQLIPETSDLTADQRAEYLGTMGSIDQGLVVNEDRAVRRGENTCAEIQQGKSEAQVLKNVRERFSGGNATVNSEGAALILEAVKVWCRPA